MQDTYLYFWKISHFFPSWINTYPFCSLKHPEYTFLDYLSHEISYLITQSSRLKYALLWQELLPFMNTASLCSAQSGTHYGCSVDDYWLPGFLLSFSVFFLSYLALAELPPPLPDAIQSFRYRGTKAEVFAGITMKNNFGSKRCHLAKSAESLQTLLHIRTVTLESRKLRVQWYPGEQEGRGLFAGLCRTGHWRPVQRSTAKCWHLSVVLLLHPDENLTLPSPSHNKWNEDFYFVG